MEFIWNTDPEIVNLFDTISLRYYSLLFAGGLALGYVVAKRFFIEDGFIEEDIEKLALWTFIATVLGARIGHCLFYEPEYYLSRPLEMILPISIDNGKVSFTGFQGLASHGGIFGVFLAIWWFARKSGKPIFGILDKISIGGALAAIFIRLGNFMNSEIIGKATGGDYGVVFQRVDAIPRHPAQLYESFSYLLIFCLIFYLYKKRKAQFEPGFIFGLFFTLLFVARFIIEFFKENQVGFEDGMALNMGQWLSVPGIIIGVVMMFIKSKRK